MSAPIGEQEMALRFFQVTLLPFMTMRCTAQKFC